MLKILASSILLASFTAQVLATEITTFQPYLPNHLEVSSHYKARTGLKVLIGNEGREITDNSKYPFTAIGSITFDTGDGTGLCTGALVDENVVLTNGHCVWDQDNGRFYEDFKFEPAKQISSNSFGSIKVKKVYVSTSYQTDEEDIDYGFLVLDEPIGRKTGWLGTTLMKFTWLFSERFYVAGYGSNFGSLSSLTPVQAVNKNACQVKRYTLLNRALVHNCDTGSGNSGSPLFTYINGLPYIVGVHFGGISDQDKNVGCKETWLPEECENYATKTNIFLKAMKEIISEN